MTIRIAIVALLLGLTVCFWVVLPARPDFDDPYIALHSARSLLDGQDTNYDVAPLYGATSPVHIALLTMLMAAGLGGFDAVRLASALGATAFTAALWFLGVQLRLATGARVLLVVTTLASGLTWVQVASGLETSWAMATVTAMIVLHLSGRHLPVAALGGLLPWLRPDAAVAGLAILGASLIAAPKSRRKMAGLAVATGAPWAFWLMAETGAPWPVTIAAKAHFFAEGCAPLAAKVARLGGGLWDWWLAVLPLGVGLAAAAFRPVGRLGLAASALSLCAFLFVLPGAVWHNHHRYLYPILLPWAAYGLAVGASMLRGRAVALLAACAVLAAVHTPSYWRPSPAGADELASVSAWLTDHVPATASIVVQDAGAAAVYTAFRLTDIVGLKSRLALDAHGRWTWPACGAERSRAIAEIVATSRAGYLVTNADWEEHFRFVEGLAAQGFRIEPVRVPPASSPGGYTVYRVTLPEGAAR